MIVESSSEHSHVLNLNWKHEFTDRLTILIDTKQVNNIIHWCDAPQNT
jgi:hypothetical protein